MSRVVRPSPAFLLTVAIIFGTATFIAVPLLLAQTLLTQNGDPSKAPEAGKGEAPKSEAPKSEAPKSETPKSEAPKSEAAKSEAAKGEAAKGEAAKGEAAKGEAAKGEAAKTEPPKVEPGKEAGGHPDESAETTRILMGPAGRGECVWIGKRIVGLLWKDDLDTALRHLKLYDRFGCPGEHLQLSFRCIVRQGDIQKDAAKEPKTFDNRVDACWMNPATPAPPANQPTAAVEKPGTK
jgi:hypothetical protein